MSDKASHWSEAHGRTDDAMYALGEDLDEGGVKPTYTNRGIVLLTDCQPCSRQLKTVLLWPEVVCAYLLQPHPQMGYSNQGLVLGLVCNSCQKQTRVVFGWPEVNAWVEEAIRRGALKPEIRGAKAQLEVKRAQARAAAAKQRSGGRL